MPGYIIYVDTLIIRLLANFGFEFLLLWATAEITRIQTTRSKLFLGAGIGTIHYFFYLLASYGVIPYYGLLRFFPMILFVSLVMLFVAFYPLSKTRRIISLLGYFYGIGFISAGAGIAAGYIFATPAGPRTTLGMLISIALILAIAELGWGVVQKRIFQHIYQIPIEISVAGNTVNLMALVDTGNKLRDPLTKQPVIIVEHQAITNLFSQETALLFKQIEVGNIDIISQEVANSELAVRLRIIPFNTIGKENGMLIGFRPDAISLKDENSVYSVKKAIIAVHQQRLDPEGNYQALIPPEILSNISFSPLTRPVQGGGTSHATSSNS